MTTVTVELTWDEIDWLYKQSFNYRNIYSAQFLLEHKRMIDQKTAEQKSTAVSDENSSPSALK